MNLRYYLSIGIVERLRFLVYKKIHYIKVCFKAFHTLKQRVKDRYAVLEYMVNDQWCSVRSVGQKALALENFYLQTVETFTIYKI